MSESIAVQLAEIRNIMQEMMGPDMDPYRLSSANLRSLSTLIYDLEARVEALEEIVGIEGDE